MTDEFEPSEAEVEAARLAMSAADMFWWENWQNVDGVPHDEFVARAALRAAAKVREQGNG